MKIGIYDDASQGIGGQQYWVAVLAEALGKEQDVDIVHHSKDLSVDRLRSFFEVKLDRVSLRYVPHETDPHGTSDNPWRRYREARAWHATLSEPYDLFICATHLIPPFCHAKHGVLLTNFPMSSRWWTAPAVPGAKLRRALSRLYYDWEWDRRLDTYQLKIGNSRYCTEWTKRRWGHDFVVVYPPVETHRLESEKTNVILSVGRFTACRLKKQLEMVRAFREIERYLPGWEYYCIGGVSSAMGMEYAEEVRRVGAGARVHVLVNVDRKELGRLFGLAKIFWHAAGYGENQETAPERNEHFGIATVEAMASGQVPVVINKGGQPEIVEDSVSGYLWNTLEEMKEYTLSLVSDERHWQEMSTAAKSRAEYFSREKSVERFLGLLKPYLS